jgi:hypothetical protein
VDGMTNSNSISRCGTSAWCALRSAKAAAAAVVALCAAAALLLLRLLFSGDVALLLLFIGVLYPCRLLLPCAAPLRVSRGSV